MYLCIYDMICIYIKFFLHIHTKCSSCLHCSYSIQFRHVSKFYGKSPCLIQQPFLMFFFRCGMQCRQHEISKLSTSPASSSVDVCGRFRKPLESHRCVGFRHIQHVITPWKINGWNLQPSHLERNMIMIWKQASMREDMFRPFIFEGLVFRMSTKRPVKSVIFFPNPPRRVPQCVLHMRSWTACERPTRGFLSPTLWSPKQPIGEMGEFSPFKMKETLGFFKWHVYMVLTYI